MKIQSLADRWTFGWDYLGAGVQIIPVMAGLLAFLIIKCLSYESTKNQTNKWNYLGAVNRRCKRYLAMEMGRSTWRAIGGFVGLVPCIGGNIADWFAYSQTVAVSKKSPDSDEVMLVKDM